MSEQEDESIYMVRDESLKTHWLEDAATDAEQAAAEALRKAMDETANSVLQSGTYNWTFNPAAGLTNCGMPSPPTLSYIGDVPWQYIPPPAPWQVAGDPVIVTQSSSTTMPNPPNGQIYHGPDWDYLHDRQLPPAPAPLIEERIREIVAEAMHKALYPEQDGLVSHQHRRVRQWDENGVEWRGVLYRVEREGEG